MVSKRTIYYKIKENNMWNPKPSFRFEIDNYLETEGPSRSKTFVAGGSEWYLYVYPKGGHVADHFSLYLHVANPTMLPTGWKRNISFYFTLLNQSDKELFRSNIVSCKVLDAKSTSLGFPKLCPLSKLQEKGLLEKDRLIIEVYINFLEDVVGEKGTVSEEIVDINGFKVLASQFHLVQKIFAEHPDINLGFKPKNHVLRTAYMNVLIGLINTLNKPSQNLSETDLTKADSELSELEEVGFNLDWLKSKLEEVILKSKKADHVYGNKVIQLEERLKNLEQIEKKRKIAEEDFLGRKKAKDDESRVQTLEERVKNLEEVESSFRMDFMKSKFGDVSLEKKKVDDADGSRVQQLEENVKNLEVIVSDLKVKLDEGKDDKSSSDGFFMVDDEEVA